MKLFASLLQISGLAAFVAGASFEFGAAGGAASAGLVAVFVGLSLERES